MSLVIKPLSNCVHLSTPSNCYRATAVLITNHSAERHVTLANTGNPNNSTDHGQYDGGSVTFVIPQNGMLIVRKRPMDTLNAGANTVHGTRVADTGL